MVHLGPEVGMLQTARKVDKKSGEDKGLMRKSSGAQFGQVGFQAVDISLLQIIVHNRLKVNRLIAVKSLHNRQNLSF